MLPSLSRASVPWPETAFRIAKRRLLSRVLHGPVVLQALLPSPAGSEWQHLTKEDLSDLKVALPDLLRELPSPAVDPAPWLSVAYGRPIQWKRLLRRYRSAKVLEQQVKQQLGFKSQLLERVGQDDASDEPI